MNNQTTQFLLFLVSKLFLFGHLILLLACATREAKELGYATEDPGLKVEVIDTIRIEYLGTITVHDIDPIAEHVLFMEGGTEKLFMWLLSLEKYCILIPSIWIQKILMEN